MPKLTKATKPTAGKCCCIYGVATLGVHQFTVSVLTRGHIISRLDTAVFTCVPEQNSIEDNKIMVRIGSIEQTGRPGKYAVSGSFVVQESAIDGFQILTKLLDLQLTGTRAESVFSDSEGFNALSVDFNILVQSERGRVHLVQGFSLEEKNEAS